MILRKSRLRGTLCVALLGSWTSAERASAAPSSADDSGSLDADAGAQESSSALIVHWNGPEECGPSSTLETETRKLLGAAADTSNVQVIASTKRLDEQRYRIELRLSGSVSGQRSLESSECREAVQAAAVVLALAINPEAILASEREPAPLPEPPVRDEPDPPAPESPEPTSSPAEMAPPHKELLWALGIAGRMGGGITPFPQFGPRVSLAMEHSFVRAALEGYFEPARSYDLQPSGSFSLSTWGGSLEVCGVIPTPERLVSRLCAGISGTRLSAKPSGLSPNQRQTAFLVAPLISGDIGVTLSRHIAVVATGAFQVPTTHPSFVVESGTSDDPAGKTTAHTVRLGGYGELGVEFLF